MTSQVMVCPLVARERPDVHVLAREDAAVDRDRQFDLDRHRVAVDLLLDDLGQIADDEAAGLPAPPWRSTAGR